MSVILFVDMLGAKKRWQTGGVDSAQKYFLSFAKLAIAVARQEAPADIQGGGLETDSLMLDCSTLSSAIKIARRLYMETFMSSLQSNAPRIWLRGCIIANNAGLPFRTESIVTHPLEKVNIFTYSKPALEAIHVEKSGFKGMRLLIQKDLITTSIKSDLRIPFANHSMLVFTTLKYSPNPKIKSHEFSDYLWMATADENEWFQLNLHMTSRLRYSSQDPDELAQAAATQVVFHEVAAIRKSVQGRAKRAASQKP